MISDVLNSNEYVPYQKMYLDLVSDSNVLVTLGKSASEFIDFVSKIPGDKLLHSYEAGKWTVNELLLHIIDTERIFQYRALRFARNDKTDLPGYDENFYTPNSNANKRSLASLIEEFKTLRSSTIALFKSFDDDTLVKLGNSGGNTMSVRAIAYIIVGHQKHHVNILKERYLV